MAPGYTYDYLNITLFNWNNLQSTGYNYNIKKVESKKDKIKRVAKERMFASWKTYNEKTPTIKEIKQNCKPSHKLNYSGRRY